MNKIGRMNHISRLAAIATGVAALFAGSAVITAQAAQDKRWYVMPMVNWTFADEDRDADGGSDDGIGGRLIFGKPLSNRTSAETSIFMKELPRDTGPDKEIQGVSFDLVRFFGKSSFRPLLLAGIGFAHSDVIGADDETDYQWELGTGFDWQMTEHGTSLRLDGRYIQLRDDASVPTEDRLNDWEVGLGIGVPLGKAPVSPSKLDTDRDGVMDDKDKCKYSALGATVDSTGCQVSEPKDDDGDGVRNELDACPGTVAGSKVDPRGCAVVSKPPPGTFIATLKGVQFKSNSSQLLPRSIPILDNAAMALKSNPGVPVVVAGYTDSVGDASYNKWLSQRRADAVRTYLISKGVDPSRISAKGYGEADPVASNSTAAGRAENRRVVFQPGN